MKVVILAGGRGIRLSEGKDETFMVNYGDGVGDVDVKAIEFHKSHGKLATLIAVRSPARFGGPALDGDPVTVFTEEPQIGEGRINGGFMVLEPGFFKYIEGDSTILETHALEQAA
jgi:glucose-1-phosphate cytidylyltransferase